MDAREEERVEAEGEVALPFAVGWTEALELQFGSAPWWLVSAVLHMMVLLALGLVVVSRQPLEQTPETIRWEPVAQEPPKVQEDEHEFFTRTSQRHDLDAEPVDEITYLPQEEPEIPDDEITTENNVDDNGARGQLEAISNCPLMQTATVSTLGLGGGGAGQYGKPWDRGKRKKNAGRMIGRRDGPSERTFPAINRALEWLARHQEPDGHWEGEKYEGKNTDVGITALATLAFLGDGHSERVRTKYRGNVIRAIGWLVRQQQADGCIGRGYEGGLGYHHAIAGIALAEAFGMGQVERTGVAAQKAVDYSVARHQTEYSGWRYEAKKDADTSVTGWFVMQLKSARTAKLRVDGRGFQGAIAFLDKCTRQDGQYPGLVSYQPARGPTPTMTAVGAVSRLFMNWKPNDPLVVGAAQNMLENLPRWEGGDVNFYYWYYATIAMFQVGGERWKAWNVRMRDTLEERQRRGAPAVDGSWDPVGAWCGQGGRVYSTAMGALILEIYHRYLPMYR